MSKSMQDSTLLGSVQDVNGSTVSISLLDEVTAGPKFIEGHGYRVGQIGSFVRIPIGYIDLYGVVSQVGAGAVPQRFADADVPNYRWITVQLVGEGYRHARFSRGISQYPTVGDSVHIVSDGDLSKIYGHPDEPNFISVGRLASAESIPALVDVNKLITRHSAVLGTTGAGKSTTVAALLLALSDPNEYPSSRIFVLDIHGEYGRALSERANVFKINPNKASDEKALFVPYWAMTFDELLAFTFGSLDDVSRGAVLEKIVSQKEESLNLAPKAGVSTINLNVDTPVPFSIHRLWFEFHKLVNATHSAAGGQSEASEALLKDSNGNPIEKGDAIKVIPPKYKPHIQTAGGEKIYLSSSPLNIRRPLEGLASRLRDQRFDFLFRPGPWMPKLDGSTVKDLDVLLKEWLGDEKPITILDLSGVPTSILNALIGAVLRIVYDALSWSRNLSEGGRERPIMLVLEEAHNYLGKDNGGNAGEIVRRIVKEGRKYGVGAMIVSQRPSEIDSTILSQCGTLVAMRLSNPTDRSHVLGTVSDNLEGLLGMLPILRTGEAIIVGEGVQLPIRTLIEAPTKSKRPDSADPLVFDSKFPGGWNRKRESSNYADVTQVWRSQNPRSPRFVEQSESIERTEE